MPSAKAADRSAAREASVEDSSSERLASSSEKLAVLEAMATAMRSLPLGTAYMVWTGIGAVGSFVVGVVFLAEPVTAMRMAAAGLIVAGIVTMKLAS